MVGERLILDLPKVLWDAFHLKRSPEFELILTPHNCRQLAHKWNLVLGHIRTPLDTTEFAEAMIAAVLGLESKFDIEEVVLQVLVYHEEVKNKIQDTHLEEIFSKILKSYGLPKGGLNEPNLIAAAVLLAELAENSEDLDLSDMKIILSEKLDQKKWARAVRKWASTVTLKEVFTKWSAEIEKEYSILERVRGYDSITDVESFRAIDVALLENIRERVEASSYEDLLKHSEYITQIAIKRKEKFWSREKFVQEWIVLLNAIAVLKSIDTARSKLDKKPDLTNMVQLYFEEFWEIDAAYCAFASTTRELSGAFIAAIQELVDSQYQSWLSESNDSFTHLVSDTKEWPVKGVEFQQHFWNKVIQKRTKTCLFLIDALRFDLQKKIVKELGTRGHKVEHVRSLSSLPTITEICMSTLLPHSSALQLEYQDVPIAVRIDGEKVAAKKNREEVIKKAWKGPIKFIEMDDFIRGTDKEIKEAKEAKFMVVWSTEIDSLGTDLSTEVLDFFDKVLQRVISAIEKVSVLGYSRIVITTDHGFLLIPNPDQVEVLDSLSGADVVYGRRYALGIPPSTNKALILPLRNIGYDSDGEVLVPHGIRFLSQPGPKKLFIHGGMSLQECCIGSLIIEPKQLADRVSVIIHMSETITSGVFKVELSPVASTLQPTSRRVRIEVSAEGRVPEKIGPFELLSDSRIEMIRLPAKCKQVTIQAVDTDTLELLDEKTAKVLLEGYDDLL